MNKSVVYLKDEIIKISSAELKHMSLAAKSNEENKFRYCFHKLEAAGMQEMLFVNFKNQYLAPHKHPEFPETQVLLDGEMLVVIFDDAGGIKDVLHCSKKENFLYRIEKEIWHMSIPLSETVAIYEVRQGPFDSNSNLFPSWAPLPNEKEAVQEYQKSLLEKVAHFSDKGNI